MMKKIKVPITTHNCIFCEKEIKPLHDHRMWNGGIVDRIDAGYGSELDGNVYLIAICDNCIIEKKFKYLGNYMGLD